MYKVELYARVRRACMVEGMSTREAARVFGLHRDTVRKMPWPTRLPPGYRRQSAPRRPKLDPYRGVIDRILEEDRSLPKKQRHTGEADLRAPESGARVHRQVHDSQRLRARAASPDTGDVCSAVPSCRTHPVRLRPGEGGGRRSGADRPLLRPGPCPTATAAS